jgi:hypothetical protein
MGGHGLNSLSIGYRPVAGSFELDSELLGYKEGKGILLWLVKEILLCVVS